MKRLFKLIGIALIALPIASCKQQNNASDESGSKNQHSHIVSDSFEHDEQYHWKTCSGCEELIDKTEHTFVETVTEPTHESGGYTTHTCSVCGYSFIDSRTEKLKYMIDFDLDGGSSDSYNGPVGVESFSKDIFFFDCVKTGWNFRGWSLNNNKVFDEFGNQLMEVTLTDDMTFVALYSQTAFLYITTNLTEAGTISGAGEYVFNTYVDVSVTVNQGYEFVGWFYNNTLLSTSESYKYMMWDQDIILETRFKLALYKINIHTSNDNYGLVLLRSDINNDYLESYEEDREYTSQITVAAFAKTDVRFLGWFDQNNQLVNTNAVYTFTMPNYDYSLEAKWNCFTITYDLNNGTIENQNPSTYTTDSGTFQLNSPTRSGYNFIGWSNKGTIITEVNSNWMEDMTLVAVWEAVTYSITYHLNEGTNNESNPSSYNIESETITLQDPSRTGYQFGGWYSDSSFENRIYQINTGSYGDLEFYAKWIIIVYSISYNLNGGEIEGSNPTTYTIECEFSFISPTLTGYQFDGWYKGNNERVNSIQPGMTGSLELTAHWIPLLNQLSVTSDDETKGTVQILSGSGYTDEQITVSASPIGDNVFKYWSDSSGIVSNNATYTFTMPASSYQISAHFITKIENDEIMRPWNLAHGVIPIVDNENQTIKYGLYPQTYVSDSAIISVLDNIEQPDSNGWYLYQNDYYEKVVAAEVYSSSYSAYYKLSDGTNVVASQTYWFKCEPIEWKILATENNTYLLLSKVLLDAHIFNELYNGVQDGHYANNYEYSQIRSFITNEFYQKAFGFGDSYIITIEIDNGTVPRDAEPYCCSNTFDRITLLSRFDYSNTSYGFEQKDSSPTRLCYPSDYNIAKNGFCYGMATPYWTRTPDSDGTHCYCIDSVGHGTVSGYVNRNHGIRPSITLQIL